MPANTNTGGRVEPRAPARSGPTHGPARSPAEDGRATSAARTGSSYRERSAPPGWPGLAVWWTQWVPDGTHHRQLVLPDGSADVVVWDSGVVEVVGPTMAPVVVDLAGGSRCRAVRIRPGALSAVFGVPATLLRDEVLPLDAVLAPAAARELTGLVVGESGVARARWPSRPPDPRARRAVAWLARDPAARVDRVAADLGMSGRQLRRLVLAHAGLGPKELHRTFRLHRFLHLAESPLGRRRRLAGLSVEAGYADQAHLSRELRALSALSPGDLLRHRAG
ncbi:helix-turn-helix domain-containing protein [Actinoalloteichus spitiensis]|uniref:helix-turn-helix domain-containing protein n=1 Tax=Actinoalloteichus spitiensis TaxID=252394 RepID=UPI0012F6A37D|nr:AraC family transcriptional regulator [Actinoalloteichus spitiensis]